MTRGPGKKGPDAALLALFATEIATHMQPLGAWLKRGFVHDGEGVPAELLRALHSINGAARVMDAQGLAELAGSVESCLKQWATLTPQQAQVIFVQAADVHAYLQRLASAPAPADFLELSAMEQKALRTSFDRSSRGEAAPSGGAKTVMQQHPGAASPGASAPMLDASLFEIFRSEVAQCVAVLSDGLVVLDTEAPTPALWERLMRAAHSLKGAARIVNLHGVAQLAHSLEDCLVLAQGGNVTLTSADIDVLLQSIDSIKQAAAMVGDGGADKRAQAEAAAAKNSSRLTQLIGGSPQGVRQAVQDLGLLRTQFGSAKGGVTVPSTPGAQGAQRGEGVVISVPPLASAPEASLLGRASSFPPPVLSSMPPAVSLAPLPPAPAPPANVTALRSGDANAHALAPVPERVLRVNAESINTLVGLAGESLVESRRVTSFAQGLTRVKKQEAVLVDLIDSIERLMSQHSGSADVILKHMVHEAKLQARECARLIVEHGTHIDGYVRRAEQLGERLYREALKSRMRPFSDGTTAFPRTVRDLARDLGKRAKVELAGQNTEVDRDALESLDAPLNHLLRNALDHGIEPPEDRVAAGKPEVAVIHIEARHHAGMLSITVGDDGRGIDPERIREKVVDRGLLANPALAATLSRAELLDFLFLPGFSTAESVSEISGRGVGLDVVKNSVEALGGSVRVTSELTKGTVFHLQLPVTRSVIRAVVAEIASEKYAFPLLRIDRIDRLPLAAVKTMENRQYILIDDTPVSLVSARHVMGVPEAEQDGAELNVVVVSDRKQRFGIVVDEFCGEQDLVVRPLDARLGKIQDIAAAAILIDGTAALIVDVDDMVRSIERMIQGGRMNRVTGTRGMPLLAAKKRVLVVDDSITVRESERQLLKNRGYDVDVAVDGVEGWSSVRNAHYDLVITDIDMPRMNGIELVKSIKGDAKLAGMPVVIVSYKDREEDRMRGLEAGANYYLTKSSFHDDKLVEAVEDLIGGAT